MITTIKNFKLMLEDLEINSDKEVTLKGYQEALQEYNANKEKFKAILLSNPQEKWEEEAEKIIDGNTYLGSHWKLSKIERFINEDEEKLKRSELTEEEKKEIQQKILDNKKELSIEQNNLSKKIREDLAEIQRL